MPITTSSQLLRDQSFTIPPRMQLFSWNDFVPLFDQTELATANGLSEKTGYGQKLTQQNAVLQYVGSMVDFYYEQYKISHQEFLQVQNLFDNLVKKIKSDLSGTYPIFSTPFGLSGIQNSSNNQEILDEAKLALKNHPLFSEYEKVYTESDRISKIASDWRHQGAKWKRLHYLLETKLLEILLKERGDPAVVNKYQQLKSCEQNPFFTK